MRTPIGARRSRCGSSSRGPARGAHVGMGRPPGPRRRPRRPLPAGPRLALRLRGPHAGAGLRRGPPRAARRGLGPAAPVALRGLHWVRVHGRGGPRDAGAGLPPGAGQLLG
eukprot:9164914-Alexandrium_andersonii.AAC.1